MESGTAGEPLEDRLRRVEEELSSAAGGESLCSISKAAGSVPAAKYLEGRLAALLQLRRAIRAGGEISACRDELSGEWREALDDVIQRDFGSDWKAYRAGGVDELEELSARLGSTPPQP